MRVARTMILLGLAVQGCAVQAPKIDVLQARLTSLGVLDQQVQVQLCVSNPNRRELAFSRVTANVAIGGERLAAAVNDTPVTLPPLGSVSLPFTVDTTTRNLGDQLGGILRSGALRYDVSGIVVLRDFSVVGIPYSVSGRVTPQMVAGGLIGMAGEPDAPSPCGPAPGAAAAS
jgi:LEA14-like dessication related protein